MNITGTVKVITPTKSIGSNTKRSLIVTTHDAKYPQTLELEFFGDKSLLINGVNPGDEVSVEADLRGREWKSPGGEIRYFMSLAAFRIATTKAAPVREAGDIPDDQIPF